MKRGRNLNIQETSPDTIGVTLELLFGHTLQDSHQDSYNKNNENLIESWYIIEIESNGFLIHPKTDKNRQQRWGILW